MSSCSPSVHTSIWKFELELTQANHRVLIWCLRIQWSCGINELYVYSTGRLYVVYICPNYQTSEYLLYLSSRTFTLPDTPYPHQLKPPALYSHIWSCIPTLHTTYTVDTPWHECVGWCTTYIIHRFTKIAVMLFYTYLLSLEDSKGRAGLWVLTSVFEQITLQLLFNFSDNTWTGMMERIDMISLNDELEFYELVELDAEGD